MKSRGKKAKLSIDITSILYIICLLRIVLFKRVSIIALIKNGINPAKREIYLKPLIGVFDMFKGIYSFFGVFQNYVGNIVLFVPLGVIVNYYGKKVSYKKSFIYGALVSISFETIQYIFAIGTSDINDVITNSLGAILGCFIYKQIEHRSKNKDIKRKRICIFILGIILVSIIYILFIVSYEKTHVNTHVYNKQIISYLKDTSNETGTYVKFNDDCITIKNNTDNKKYTYKVNYDTKYYCINHRKVYGDFANNVVSNYYTYYESNKDSFLNNKSLKSNTKIKIYINNNNVEAILYLIEKN